MVRITCRTLGGQELIVELEATEQVRALRHVVAKELRAPPFSLLPRRPGSSCGMTQLRLKGCARTCKGLGFVAFWGPKGPPKPRVGSDALRLAPLRWPEGLRGQGEAGGAGDGDHRGEDLR